MKIGIHHEKGTFSDRWITYCEANNINYKLVNCYKNDIISQLQDCDALMWHHHHENTKDILFAKQLFFALQQSGKITFPDFNTSWHFDDKLGQKYLFEAIGAPYVPSYVFYSKKDAYEWIKTTSFPKVFKLRRGAGSANVKLVRTVKEAHYVIDKAFGRGFPQFDRLSYFKDRLNKYRNGTDKFIEVVKAFGRLFINTEFGKSVPNEKGYAYFQDFIPDNQFDIRIVVIAGKAFGLKRMVRKDDFRASGSGQFVFGRENFSKETIQLSFELSEKLNLQCAAFDFVYDETKRPFVVELSYGFSYPAYDKCVGYWDQNLKFHEGQFFPQHWMVELVLNNCIQISANF